MEENISKKLSDLRKQMQSHGLQAYVIPSSDRHLSEYVPKCWKDREWISGFNGSAGTVVVTLDEAGLWTDSRYFLQASQQLDPKLIKLFKMGVPGTPSIAEYLRNQKGIKKVGFFGMAMPLQEARSLQNDLKVAGITVETEQDLVTAIRDVIDPIPNNKFTIQPLKYAGRSITEKVADVRKELQKEGANTQIITMLDEVAWLFNVRSKDVDYNPVGISYALIGKDYVNFYTLPEKLDDKVRSYLEEYKVTIKPYDDIYADVKALKSDDVLLVDPVRTNYALFSSIPEGCKVVHKLSPVTLLKACKNESEYEGYKVAMKRDGVALTRFFMWLEKALADGETPSEYEVGIKLNEFRAKGDYFVSDSFATIAGYNGHGAIVHYSAKPETSYNVKPEGMLLLDSGGQYEDGTTDITRTISLDGKPTQEQKDDYTRVMKGHIALATAIYPEGTRGSQLDILARKALWDNCQNYGHGTGHGIGHFLNVHEGPQNIRMEENPTTLHLGMVTSNEPGLYLTDKYGIRIENLIRTIPYKETEFGAFYAFETLTLCYFDNNLINVDMLTDKELQWYNNYQQRVYNELSPLLESDEAKWLKERTQPLSK